MLANLKRYAEQRYKEIVIEMISQYSKRKLAEQIVASHHGRRLATYRDKPRGEEQHLC